MSGRRNSFLWGEWDEIIRALEEMAEAEAEEAEAEAEALEAELDEQDAAYLQELADRIAQHDEEAIQEWYDVRSVVPDDVRSWIDDLAAAVKAEDAEELAEAAEELAEAVEEMAEAVEPVEELAEQSPLTWDDVACLAEEVAALVEMVWDAKPVEETILAELAEPLLIKLLDSLDVAGEYVDHIEALYDTVMRVYDYAHGDSWSEDDDNITILNDESELPPDAKLRAMFYTRAEAEEWLNEINAPDYFVLLIKDGIVMIWEVL